MPTSLFMSQDETIYHQLLAGIDTLGLTIGGNSPPSQQLLHLYEIVKTLRETPPEDLFKQETSEVEFFGVPFQIYLHSTRPYSFAIHNPLFGHIKFWSPDKWKSANKNKQHIHVKFASHLTRGKLFTDIHPDIEKIIHTFFSQPELVKKSVSLLDLHADIAAPNFLSREDLQHFVTRSHIQRAIDGKEDTTKTTSNSSPKGVPASNRHPHKHTPPAEPSCLPETLLTALFNDDQEDFDVLSTTERHRQLETVYFGNRKSPIMTRIYDKTKQLQHKPDDDLLNIFKQLGWNSKTHPTILRTEFSLKRDALKEFVDEDGTTGKFTDFDFLMSNQDKVWTYLTFSFITMRQENRPTNKKRSPLTGFWKLVQSSFNNSPRILQRIRKFAGKVQKLQQQAFGCLHSAAALLMPDTYDNSTLSSFVKSIQIHFEQPFIQQAIKDRRRKLGFA